MPTDTPLSRAQRLAAIALGALFLVALVRTPSGASPWRLDLPERPQVVERTVTLAAPEVQPLLTALARATEGRAALGFTPLPAQADEVRYVALIGGPAENDDVTLSMYYAGKSRIIGFEHTADGLRWASELETFPGPGTYVVELNEGPWREMIEVMCDRACTSNPAPERLHIVYAGRDPRLTPVTDLGQQPLSTNSLTLAQVAPVLAEWGAHTP